MENIDLSFIRGISEKDMTKILGKLLGIFNLNVKIVGFTAGVGFTAYEVCEIHDQHHHTIYIKHVGSEFIYLAAYGLPVNMMIDLCTTISHFIVDGAYGKDIIANPYLGSKNLEEMMIKADLMS